MRCRIAEPSPNLPREITGERPNPSLEGKEPKKGDIIFTIGPGESWRAPREGGVSRMPTVHQLPCGKRRVAAGGDTAMSRPCTKHLDLAAVGLKRFMGDFE